MKVLHLSDRIDKPFLPHNIQIAFLICDRSCRYQISLIRVTGNADQVILICLIEQIHFLIHRIHGKILILDDTVIHRIGNTAHIPKIGFQIDRGLVQKLLGTLDRHIFHTIDKTVI